MEHVDHLRLIREGIPTQNGAAWADFGAGEGAFTLALADLLGPGGVIYAVDREAGALGRNAERIHARFPRVTCRPLTADYTHALELPPLDGIVMANALHFQRDKAGVLALLRGYLKPGGRLVLVEYNAERGNPWVPYPLSYPTWKALAQVSGFTTTRLLATVPSRFLREIYSALSLRGA